MTRPIRHFWPALESVVGLSAVKAEWAWLLGGELPWALGAGLLACSGEVAGAYPRQPGVSPSPLPYEVVEHGDDEYVGVCPDGWERVPLTREQLTLWEVDRRRLSGAVAAALSVRAAFEPGVLPFTSRVGFYHRGAGGGGGGEAATPVYLTLGLEPCHLAAAALGLAAPRAACVLLAPTRRLATEDCYRTCRAGGVCFAALEELLAVADEASGRFIATRALGPLLAEQRGRAAGAGAAEEAAGTEAEAGTGEGPAYYLRQRGQGWELRFAGRDPVHLRPALGYVYLRELLRFPGKRFSVGELLVAARGDKAALVARGGGGGEAIDEQARRAYALRLRELDEDLEEAKADQDLAHQARVASEREQLLAQVRAAGFRTGAAQQPGLGQGPQECQQGDPGRAGHAQAARAGRPRPLEGVGLYRLHGRLRPRRPRPLVLLSRPRPAAEAVLPEK